MFFDRVNYDLTALHCSFLWAFKEEGSPLLRTKNFSQTVIIASFVLSDFSLVLFWWWNTKVSGNAGNVVTCESMSVDPKGIRVI